MPEPYKAKATLAIPAWKSSYYWPIICPSGWHLAEFIHSWYYLVCLPELLVAGKSGGLLGDALTADTVLAFVWFDFSIPPRGFSHGFCTVDFFGTGHWLDLKNPPTRRCHVYLPNMLTALH